MNFVKEVTIEVNGKVIKATVSVQAPELDVDTDCLNAKMILAAVANDQNITYHSRHHKNRTASIQVKPMPATRAQAKLKLVA